ncbi:Hypothetical protein AAM4_1795 [Actinomyces succiniciruminis]|uniref:Uncharacterized protein n=1 Tax=Actinomyces succiniciruminis TaxID=1522002 RepID=A0A1L7RCG3_9ACTO|nr:Hypothetical protein AAM4_1795 [Actinomyces succiniciruminis]
MTDPISWPPRPQQASRAIDHSPSGTRIGILRNRSGKTW